MTHLLTGPKSSRRFGNAININFGPAGHSCHWQCVYCPWKNEPQTKSKTTKKATQPKKEDPNKFLARVNSLIKKTKKLDTLVLGGNTEPTLNSDLGEIISSLLATRKQTKGKWKIICLTNGEGFTESGTIDQINKLDGVYLKIDCAEDVLFKKAINPTSKTKPATLLKDAGNIKALYLQTTLWKHNKDEKFQNWSAENLKGLLGVYNRLQPRGIHLTTVHRQSRDSAIQPVTPEEMEAFAQRISEEGLAVDIYPE